MRGMGAAQSDSTLDIHARTGDDRARVALAQRFCVARVAQEDQFIGLGLTQGCEARNREARVTLDRASDERRQLGQRNRPERSRHDLAGE